MVSVIANITEKADVEVFGIRWRPLFILKQAACNMLTGLSGYANSMIRFLALLAVILAWIFSV